MTNDEAILHMTLRREELKHSVSSDLDEDIKAFDVAIKALETVERLETRKQELEMQSSFSLTDAMEHYTLTKLL